MSIVPKQPFGFSGHNDDDKTRVAGKYVHEKSGTYYLELGPSGNFVLFQGTEIMGTYSLNGGAVTLFVAGKPISTARMESGSIVDDQGDRWVRATAPAITPPAAPPVERPPQVEHPPQAEPTPPPQRRNEPSAAAKLIGDVAPKLVQLTDDVLFGDVWERKELSKRDRSLITVAALVALNRPDQLRFHLTRAVENGVRQDELIELITHLAFYAGWPNAMTAVMVAKELFSKS